MAGTRGETRLGAGGALLLALAFGLPLTGCIPPGAPPPGYGRPPPPYSPPQRARPPRRAQPAEEQAPPAIRTTRLPASLPQAAPAWVARKVTPDAQTVAAQSYIVRPGDTLGAIARRTGAGLYAIAAANGLSQPYTVMVGQRLAIPGGRYHQVREGETGIAIARAYGVEWSRIVALNDLEEPYILRTGDRLLLPSDAEVASMSIEDRAAAFHLDIDDLITGGEPAIDESQRPATPSASTRRTLPSEAAVAPPARFAGRFDWPFEGRILSSFGPHGNGRRNDGINIAADKGDPIRAAADGVVAYVGDEIAVYGGLILIKHGQGWITAYGHADALLVKRGQSVKRGEIIGRAGDTGSVDRPQLHFEIRKGRTPVDPLSQLPKRD